MLQIPKRFIQKSVNLFGYRISKIDKFDPVMNRDENFKSIYNKCKKYTMTTKERMYALYKSVEYIINSKIPGSFVECGVYKGGSTMLIAYTLLLLNKMDRKIYLYDTFEGMTKPTEDDYSIVDKKIHAVDRWRKEQKKDYNKWCFSPLPEVKNNMFSTGYPKDKIVFVKGRVENTIPEIIPLKIALLRLDTDLHESTRHELNYLFPILAEKGVLIIDDYGYWAGSKKAVDEYFSKTTIFLHRIDDTGRIGIKTK